MFALIFCMITAMAGGEGEVTLTAAVDLHGWIRSGAAKGTFPKIHTGNRADLFDGDPHTLVRCGEAGLAEFSFTFSQPTPFYQLLIDTTGGGVYRWRAEASAHAGERLAPLFSSWQYIKAGELKPVPIRSTQKIASLKIIIERLSLGEEIVLCELGCYSSLKIRKLLLENCPEKPRVGVPFQPSAVAIDQFAGRLRLDEGVRFFAHPSSMVEMRDDTCIPKHDGKAGLRFSFGNLTSSELLLNIAPPDPPPRDPEAQAFCNSLSLAFSRGSEASEAFAICCRNDGDPAQPRPIRITQNTRCTIYGLQPESVYHLSAAGLDENGDRITPYCEELRISTYAADALPLCRIASIDALIPIYTQGFTDEEIACLIKGFEQARLFIFRSSKARLSIDHQYILLSGSAPTGRAPGMNPFDWDLRDRGVLDRSFGAVHVVAKDITENCSGYLFHNQAVGSQGITALERWPDEDAPITHTVCWTWVHEFQHSFEQIASRNAKQYACPLNGHFEDNYPLPLGVIFDAGDAYDGQCETYRHFAGYEALPAPPFRFIEATDADNDGLPDDDPRLPFDEKRFLSDSRLCDTDEDGMSDLDEFCAGLYRGCDPLNPDSDADEIIDGADAHPLCRFTGSVPFGTPRRGEIPEGLLSKGVSFSNFDGTEDLTVHASWDHDFLYLSFESKAALSMDMAIDGSGHLGPFETDRAVQLQGAPENSGRAGSDVYVDERLLHVVFGNPHLLCGHSKVIDGHVLSAERNGHRLMWIAIPAALGPGTSRCHIKHDAHPARGLTLEAGRVLGFRFTVFPANAHKERTATKWCSLYETHRFYDAVLLPEK